MSMAQSVIHISEEEAAKDFATLLVRVHAGAEIVIEQGAQPIAAHPGRLLSGSIALAKIGKATYLKKLPTDFEVSNLQTVV